MDGSVQVLTYPDLDLHIYTAPPTGYSVNSLVLELRDRLIVVDGQMTLAYATEVGDVVEGLGKRIDRFVLSHTHPDHYSGFVHLTQRFPGVQLAALPAVRENLIAKGDQVLQVRRDLFGDQIPAHAVIPDATIIPGELTIAGVRFVFQQYDDTEAEHTLTVVLPDLGVRTARRPRRRATPTPVHPAAELRPVGCRPAADPRRHRPLRPHDPGRRPRRPDRTRSATGEPRLPGRGQGHLRRVPHLRGLRRRRRRAAPRPRPAGLA